MTEAEEETKGAVKYRDTLIWFMLFILSEKPMHGYEIIKRIRELTMNQWKPAAGSIYPLLSYMKDLGLVDIANIEENKVRGGKKITYTLTDKGWEEFRELLLKKSDLYMNFLSFIVKNSIRRLREHGYNEDASLLCDRVSSWAKELIESAQSECGGPKAAGQPSST
ncbi:PadR family transcriptional regulator [Acidilobus sp.]|jgi:DNA-binding PadR family transcriptional regulator|uniref:PadR family transcriptional regulator n=1 Tax=Acidilobus sp. TaxID=1872109 RepID=UPI003CFEE374